MKKYHIRSLPAGFSTLAKLALNALEGNLYAIGAKLILTDETDDVEAPSTVFESFEELENWLVGCVAEWTAGGKDNPMFEVLEEGLGGLI